MSFIWLVILFIDQKSLFSWKSEQPFLFVQDLTHPSKRIIFIIYCYNSACWLGTEEAVISKQAT